MKERLRCDSDSSLTLLYVVGDFAPVPILADCSIGASGDRAFASVFEGYSYLVDTTTLGLAVEFSTELAADVMEEVIDLSSVVSPPFALTSVTGVLPGLIDAACLARTKAIAAETRSREGRLLIIRLCTNDGNPFWRDFAESDGGLLF